ncbi:MAG: ABC transporter permease [Deltaproteobacteria bacterium]|nr:ABC transporter permease [Deltaproteobacteria bacterium]
MPYELTVGIRYLRGRRRFLSSVVLIASVGIAFGVAALIDVLGITHGFERVFRDKVLGVKSHAEIMKRGTDFVEYDEIAAAVRKVPGVLGATPYKLREGMVSAPGGIAWVSVKGVDPKTVGEVLNLREYLARGKISDLATQDGAVPGCLLGTHLMKKLKADIGNEVELLLAGESWRGGSGAPRHKLFRVVGEFSSGMYEFDSHLAIVGLPELQALAAEGGVAQGVELRVANPMSIKETTPLIEEALKPFWDASKFERPLYTVRDWQVANSNLFRALFIQRIVLTIILCCIIVVAACNIVCTLILIVLERRREIAILMTMGATSGGVLRIFATEGLGIGLLGTVGGLGLGLGFLVLLNTFGFGLDPKIYFVSALPVEISVAEILFVAGASMLISLGATVYPAVSAASFRPVDGLRVD